MEPTPINGEKLTTWSVLADGARVSLDFVAAGGSSHRIVLPVDVLSGLMMTLPRMLQSALNKRFPGGSLRIVQPLGEWKLEQREIDGGLILRLGTKDGFEVAFTLSADQAGSLGAGLVDTDAPSMTRAN